MTEVWGVSNSLGFKSFPDIRQAHRMNHPCAHCGKPVPNPCHWRGPITSPLHKECLAGEREAAPANSSGPYLKEGPFKKGGLNRWPSQVVERPAAPRPMFFEHR